MIPEWLALTSDTLPVEARVRLLSAVWKAHRDSALDNADNVSNCLARVVAESSHSGMNAVVAAMLSLGGSHGPIAQAREVLFGHIAPPVLPEGVVVPGFGNSFYAGSIDPNWTELAGVLRDEYPDVWAPIEHWSELLKEAGKPCTPNPASLTAAVAELVGWPHGFEFLLLVMPRMTVWARLASDTLAEAKPILA